jgi:Gram-negative bacterial TonB protein C-terminal
VHSNCGLLGVYPHPSAIQKRRLTRWHDDSGSTLQKGSVIFERKGAVGTLFEAKSLLEPCALALPAAKKPAIVPSTLARAPEFLVSRKFFRTSWFSRLGTLLSRYPSHLTFIAGNCFHDIPLLPRRFAGKQFGISLVLHAGAFMALPFLMRYLPFQVTQAANVPDRDQQVIYYHLAAPDIRQPARMLPPGPGAAPGSGSQPELPPVKGASSSQMLFAVSHPKVPDNNHQTIIQPLSPPDLRIKAELKLPNMLLAKPQPPKVPLHFNPKEVKPLQQANREVVTIAPNLTPANVQQPLTDQLLATNSQPKLAVPIGAAPAPNMPSSTRGSATDVGAPEIQGNGTPGEGLLILGTAPGTSSDMVALPPGNRYGDFSIAPGGSGSGAPGGQPGGSPNGGTGGGTTGGTTDATGVGPGSIGGGGNGSAGAVSIPGSGGENSRSLGNLEAEHIVFALPKILGPRKSTMLVAAGPMGGGGLGVYGALHCGKIYTVFLPAPGKSWTLQYCQTPRPGTEPAPRKTYTSVVRMEEAIVPPEPELRFDFKRTPLPFEKQHKYVILQGRIGEDGKVADLVVHQGLSAEMDAAAKQAFSQWTFKPAIRGGKPISIDILVGVPSDPPPKPAGTLPAPN